MKKILSIAILFFSLCVKGQVIPTVAGTGSSTHSGDSGAAVAAGVPTPTGGTFDKYGNFYVTCQYNSHRVRKIDNSGIISSVAGNGTGAYGTDGVAATATSLNLPCAVRLDTSGNIYICDVANHRIRKVDASTGIITTIAGTGTGGFSGDSGQATAAKIYAPNDICLDKFGNLYIADLYNYRVRKVSPSGVITTIAGNGSMGSSGDGGAATVVELDFPVGLATDDSGNIYIADNGSLVSRVRKVNVTTGIITNFAGNGSGVYAGDGMPATNAAINPIKITFDALHNLYIADSYNNRVYKVDSSTGILYNVAGNGAAADTGDGNNATSAAIYSPAGLAFDPCGNLYITAAGKVSVAGSGKRIRKVTYPANPTISIATPAAALIGGSVTATATVASAGVNYSIKWYNRGVLFNTTTVPTVTYTKTMCTDSITAMVYGCSDSAMSTVHVVGCSNAGVTSPISSQRGITCYPNPVSGELTIAASGEKISSIVFTNMLGGIVFRQTYNSEEQVKLRMDNLNAGMYLVKVNGVYMERVVKQ